MTNLFTLSGNGYINIMIRKICRNVWWQSWCTLRESYFSRKQKFYI